MLHACICLLLRDLVGDILFLFAADPSATIGCGSQVRSLTLIRMLKLERYVRAFSVFDDVIRDNLDIFAVSGFFALVAWIFASSLL